MAKTETKEKETIEVNGGSGSVPAVQSMQAPSGFSRSPLGSRGVQLQSVTDIWSFADWVIKAGLAPKSAANQQAVCLIVAYGMELGITPMASLQNIYIVGNRPALYGEIGIALAMATGQMESFKEWIEGDWPEDECTAYCAIKRKGFTAEFVKSFSVEDCKIAGLFGQNVHKTYPKDLMQWKATWRSLKRAFPDVLKGIAGYEDIIDTTFEDVPPQPQETPRKPKSSKPQVIESDPPAQDPEPQEKPAAKVKKQKAQAPAPDPEVLRPIVEILDREPGDESEAAESNPLDLPPPPVERGAGYCQCGEKMDSRTIDFWRDKPASLERLCYTCAVAKRQGKPYGQERER
jgi:hypothetical protein